MAKLSGQGARSNGWWWGASRKCVILNLAAQAEGTNQTEAFYSPNSHMALQSERSFGNAKTLPWNNDLALQTLTSFERLVGDAIESSAAEIFRGALNRRSSGLPDQTHRPMQCYSRLLAAIAGCGHAALANPLRDGRGCSIHRFSQQFPYGTNQGFQVKRFLKKRKLAGNALIISELG